MTILEFAQNNPWLAFFLAFLPFQCVFCCWNRFMRSLNIRRQGWPPAHCDADGDFKR